MVSPKMPAPFIVRCPMDKTAFPCDVHALFEVIEPVQEDHPILDWKDGVPVARAFDDPYFSLEDGLAETRFVFLDGSGFPKRFRDGFQIAELGFGTGLNAFATWALWRAHRGQGRLHYTAFERFPMPVADMAQALRPYPEIWALAAPVLKTTTAPLTSLDAEDFQLRVITGDARACLPIWEGVADAWYLDGFSPAKNPELWEPTLLAEVARHTASGGTVATYTAAGAVRRALTAAGFEVERRPGYGRKRHMTVAVLR